MSTPSCAQCGRPLPSDANGIARGNDRALAGATETEEMPAAMLLCPDCAEEDRLGEYDQGEAD